MVTTMTRSARTQQFCLRICTPVPVTRSRDRSRVSFNGLLTTAAIFLALCNNGYRSQAAKHISSTILTYGIHKLTMIGLRTAPSLVHAHVPRGRLLNTSGVDRTPSCSQTSNGSNGKQYIYIMCTITRSNKSAS